MKCNIKADAVWDLWLIMAVLLWVCTERSCSKSLRWPVDVFERAMGEKTP